MFLLTHEITNLISQAQDESLFVRRLETGADLLFHFLARLNCKGYKGVFSVNLVMEVRTNLFAGHFAARKICKKVTSLTGGPNWPFRWLDKSLCSQRRAHIYVFMFCSYQNLGLWLAWCEQWWYEKLRQVGGRPRHHRLSTAFHLYEVISDLWLWLGSAQVQPI